MFGPTKHRKWFSGKRFPRQLNSGKHFPFLEISISGKYVFSGNRFTTTKRTLRNTHSPQTKTSSLFHLCLPKPLPQTLTSLTDPRQPTQPPSSKNPTTIIKPHNNPATIPFNQATINEIHIPIQKSKNPITIIKPHNKNSKIQNKNKPNSFSL